MGLSRVEADVVSYNSAMGACLKAGQQHHVPDLFQQLCAVQVPPDLVTFNTMIRACGVHWQKVCDLLQDLEGSSLEPDLVTYSSAMSVFEKQGHWEEVLGLLEKLSVNKVETDRILWNSIVSACAKGRQWEHAAWALETLLPASLRADIITYNAAINGLGKRGEWELAHQRLVELKARQCQANLVTHNAVINSSTERQKCRRLGQYCGSSLRQGWKQTLSLSTQPSVLEEVEAVVHGRGFYLDSRTCSAAVCRSMP